MKKTIVKLVVFILIFMISLWVIGKITNRGNENLTMEMSPATFPIVTMVAKADAQNTVWDAAETENAEIGMIPYSDTMLYNQLHGYAKVRNPAYQRETITQLGADREVYFVVDTYQTPVNDISVEVRSLDGNRLIESIEVTEPIIDNRSIHCSVQIKDLIEKDKEYMLVILLETEDNDLIRYYTRIIWSDSTYVVQKLSFAREFHDLLFDKEEARNRNLTKYLETDSSADNTSFHKVTIHNSFAQITWGDLQVTKVTQPMMRLTELGSQTAAILLNYIVSASEGKETEYYEVEEAFQIRLLSNADRMYLLNYERTMTQIPKVKSEIYENDKIMLGIVDENLELTESEDGNVVIFYVAGRLCCYNMNTNKMTVLFSFYDEDNADARTLYRKHDIKILDVDEGGNISFAVYGYMNRGRHEGEVGVEIYYFNNALNTIEEIVYIPSDKNADILAKEIDKLLYLNRNNQLYILFDGTVFMINLTDQSCEKIISMSRDVIMGTSDNHKVLAWQEGEEREYSNALYVVNLGSGSYSKVTANENTILRLLGFMGEDVIYGVTRVEDITSDNAGKLFYPMHKICICDSEGSLLKESEQENIFVTDCQITKDQIVLNRVKRKENGTFQETSPDYIMINEEAEEGKNQLVVINNNIYKKMVQIQTRIPIGEKRLQVRSPKEVVFEGGRELSLNSGTTLDRYYVYHAYGLCDISMDAATAVELAYSEYATVVDDHGNDIWKRGNLATRNQIMAIKGEAYDETRSSLAVCLDAILKKEGISHNTQALLDQGKTAEQILEEELHDCKLLDLTGVSLDRMLYYVNRDIPVLAFLKNGESVLVTGFNEFNVILMNPITGQLEKKGKKDAAQWFEENGNSFITYSYTSQ